MSIRLIPPGKRHGNKVYYAEIRVKGRRAEISTRTRDAKLAREFAEAFEAELYKRHVLGHGTAETVAEAVERYIAIRRPRAPDRRYLDAVRSHIGKLTLDQVSQKTFDQTALFLYPNAAPETWNRQVYTPLQAVLRHSGTVLLIRRPKMKKPRNRAVPKEIAQALLANATDPDLHALLTVFFYTGCRLSEAMALTPERVDFQGRRICFDMGKTDQDHWRPMHEAVFEALSGLPRRDDRIFRWKSRSGHRKPLRELCKRTGVHFTAHMGRHAFATWLQDAGVNMRDLMDAGGWSDPKSVMRYIGSNVERVRKAVDKL